VPAVTEAEPVAHTRSFAEVGSYRRAGTAVAELVEIKASIA
jgi:hypothetical protein